MTDARRTSVAVMARRVEPADSLDFFPTPPWATRGFCEHVLPAAWPWPDKYNCAAWDPACGEGHMAMALEEYFPRCLASDIHPYGYGHVSDFLHPEPAYLPEADWIITNPPFNQARDFIIRALGLANRGVAMLVRTQFQEGEERYRTLFNWRPPALIAQYVERVPMHRGRWVPKGKTASSYEWFVWLPRKPHECGQTRFLWIPKSRLKCSRHDDWLRFSGCSDLPESHAAMKIQREGEKPAGAAIATIGEVREHLEELL